MNSEHGPTASFHEGLGLESFGVCSDPNGFGRDVEC